MRLNDQLSLFQKTALRFQSHGFSRPIIVTCEEYRFHVVEQMGEVGLLPELIILEPSARNTAAAALAATLAQSRKDPDSLCVLAPSDHIIPDVDAFTNALLAGTPSALNGQIVTLGITPTHPETGFGYLKLARAAEAQNETIPLSGFVEKPDLERAQAFLESRLYLWNAGIFLFRCSDMIAAFKQHAEHMIAPVNAALDQCQLDLGFTRLSEKTWKTLPDISIDYAIMEKTTNICTVPFDGYWSDLGSWQGVWRDQKDRKPTTGTAENTLEIDCQDSLLMSEDPNQILVGLGLRDLVAVASKDAILVADRARSAEVGTILKTLKARNLPQATTHRRDFRPWGWFETLVTGAGFQVKIITVHPRGILSLQSHDHRAEHWIVVDGQATVTINHDSFDLRKNESTYIPKGALHRLENCGVEDLVMIEVQTGSYVGEDDIVRYEDVYARNNTD